MIRSATKGDIEAFAEDSYLYQCLSKSSFRGVVCEEAGEILGIAALVNTGDQLSAISAMKEGMRAKPVSIMKTARKFAEILNRYGQGAYAHASSKEKNARNFLLRVGFNEAHGDVFVWGDGCQNMQA